MMRVEVKIDHAFNENGAICVQQIGVDTCEFKVKNEGFWKGIKSDTKKVKLSDIKDSIDKLIALIDQETDRLTEYLDGWSTLLTIKEDEKIVQRVSWVCENRPLLGKQVNILAQRITTIRAVA